jgi:hypothetical protein
MTPAYVSRRRAEEFDAQLSAPAMERDAASVYADLLALVGELQAVPPVAARAEFVADLRADLVVEAARLSRPAVDDATRLRLTPRQRHGVRERRLATVLGGFAIVAASGSMAMASQSALPGDVLYPVKRAIENAHTNLQSDDAARAQTLIDHAERRLQEAEQLTAEGADASTVADTLQDFTDQSNQAAELAIDNYAATGDQASIGELRTFTTDSMGELSALGDAVPDDARGALITAAQSVQQADEAAFNACPTCGDGGVTELPSYATHPVSNPLLSFETTASGVPVTLDFLDKVEIIAGHTPQHTRKPGKGQSGGDEPVTTPDTDPVTDPLGDEPNPLDDLGDQIKDDLDDDHSHDLDPVVAAVTGVPEALPALIDGLLGN